MIEWDECNTRRVGFSCSPHGGNKHNAIFEAHANDLAFLNELIDSVADNGGPLTGIELHKAITVEPLSNSNCFAAGVDGPHTARHHIHLELTYRFGRCDKLAIYVGRLYSIKVHEHNLASAAAC